MKPRVHKITSIGVAALLALGLSTPYGGWAADAAKGTKARIYGDAERGRVIATKWCGSCHGDRTTNDQIPTFAAIASGPVGRPDMLRAFLNAPHKPMPPLQLTNQEIEDVVAFIERQK